MSACNEKHNMEELVRASSGKYDTITVEWCKDCGYVKVRKAFYDPTSYHHEETFTPSYLTKNK